MGVNRVEEEFCCYLKDWTTGGGGPLVVKALARVQNFSRQLDPEDLNRDFGKYDS